MPAHYNVLFVCTANSARSIMAEAILNHKATRISSDVFTAYSAGSRPLGTVRPEALHQLAAAGIPIKTLSSKSWHDFATPAAPLLDFIFTVCDNAVKERCPLLPGQPMSAHWGVPDPAAENGTADEIARAFHDAYVSLDRRISLFLALPLATLHQFALQKEVENIGRS